jgi:hypothetical protein
MVMEDGVLARCPWHYKATEHQLIDILTKALRHVHFQEFYVQIGVNKFSCGD